MDDNQFRQFQAHFRTLPLVPDFEAKGFEIRHSGGGCSGLIRENPDKSVFYITEPEGCGIPRTGDMAFLGFYSARAWAEADIHDLFAHDFADMAAALKFVTAYDSALAESDIHKALAPLQDAIGQDDGGIASVVFSGPDGEAAWPHGEPTWRAFALARYLHAEALYSGAVRP